MKDYNRSVYLLLDVGGSQIKGGVLDETGRKKGTMNVYPAHAGIVITASHNSAQYNEYKVYWQDGARQIAALMEKLRSRIPEKLGGYKVLALQDYEKGITKTMESGKEESTGLPKSNVLYFELAEEAWCCVRPSGTEPKIKFYAGVKGSDAGDAESKMNALMTEVKALTEEA